MRAKPVLFACLVLSLVAAGFFAYRWRKADTQLRKTVAWTDSLVDSLATTVTFPNPPYLEGVRDSVYWQWVATGAQLRARQMQGVVRHWVGLRQTLLDSADMIHLKEQGLTDPPRQLRESLVARADLIPFPGVHGGTMRIEDESIVLLEPPYAFTGFDDGHIVGFMLLAYSVKPDGRIEWTRLWARLDE
jgi:hypothetical protein